MVRLMDRDTREQAPPLISRELAKSQGKTRFFPGLRCYKGHLAERYVSNGMCVQCQVEYAAARRAAASSPPQPQEPNQGTAEMPSPSTWQFVDKGRYALEYQGHVLQAVTNPDREDKRRYIAVVDKTPLGAAYSLNEAKTKAIRHVINQHSKAKAERIFRGYAAGQDDAAVAPVPEPQAAPPAEPLPDLLSEPEPEPQPEPDPAPQPVTVTQPAATLPAVADPQPDAVTALFTVRVSGHDVVAALSALQAAADMLRELGHVDCEITLPRAIRL
jgi:hypothetical protein